MINKIDRTWWFKLNGLLRQMHVSGVAGCRHRHLVLTEYPKSGGTWLSMMLAATSGLPYPRNRLPMRRPSVIHGCYLSVAPIHRCVVLYRDGRDVMVSYYFHALMHNSLKSTQRVDRLRRRFAFEDVEDVRRNLPSFIEECFARRIYPGFTWPEFVRRWQDAAASASTSYEKLHADTFGAMRSLLNDLEIDGITDEQLREIIERYSFTSASGRAPGEECIDDFARKGIVGDWKGRFNREAREMFHHYAGDELIALGYESSDAWVAGGSSDSKVTS